MSSADANNIGIKLQAAGENLNTWGDPNLNNDFIVLSSLCSGWNAEAIAASVTVSETNYSTTNATGYATKKFTAGGVAAAFNYVLPSRAKLFTAWNTAGYAQTFKLAATTGFALPTGRIAVIGTDGSTDVYNMTPNYGGVTVPTTGSLDIPAWSAVETAIANAGLPATAGTVRVSGTDTTAGYISVKETAKTNGGLVRSTLNAGANEQNQFALDYTNLPVSTNVAAADRVAVYDTTGVVMAYQTRATVVGKYGLVLQADQTSGFTATVNNLWPCDTTAGSYTVVFPLTPTRGDVWGVVKFGTGTLSFTLNGSKWYGGTAVPGPSTGEGMSLFYYTGSTRGWIDL